jgi:hypothetical protein
MTFGKRSNFSPDQIRGVGFDASLKPQIEEPGEFEVDQDVRILHRDLHGRGGSCSFGGEQVVKLPQCQVPQLCRTAHQRGDGNSSIHLDT